MKLPKKISPCPIIDAIVELRFDSNEAPDAIFGIFYSALKDEYSSFNRLPILEFPASFREKDANLKYLPHYQLINKDFTVQVGPHVVSISATGKYLGWSHNYAVIKGVLNKIKSTGIINEFTRIGFRYVDFFENDIFNEINLKIEMDGKPYQTSQLLVQSTTEDSGVKTRMEVSNKRNIIIGNNQKNGSLIDLDTFYENKTDFDESIELIDRCHSIQKKIFFGLLKDSFIEKLNPEY